MPASGDDEEGSPWQETGLEVAGIPLEHLVTGGLAFGVHAGFVRIVHRSEVTTETGDALSDALADVFTFTVGETPVGLGFHVRTDTDVREDVAVIFAVDNVANLGSHFVLNEVLGVACLQESAARIATEEPRWEVVGTVGGFAMARWHGDHGPHEVASLGSHEQIGDQPLVTGKLIAFLAVHKFIEVAVVGLRKAAPDLDQFRFGKFYRIVESFNLALKFVGLAERQQRLVVVGREGTAFP